jgi:hypothetical protein
MDEQIGFHHQDKIRTPLSEWLFMGAAIVTMLVGLPMLIAVLFEFGLPVLGRLWNH